MSGLHLDGIEAYAERDARCQRDVDVQEFRQQRRPFRRDGCCTYVDASRITRMKRSIAAGFFAAKSVGREPRRLHEVRADALEAGSARCAVFRRRARRPRTVRHDRRIEPAGFDREPGLRSSGISVSLIVAESPPCVIGPRAHAEREEVVECGNADRLAVEIGAGFDRAVGVHDHPDAGSASCCRIRRPERSRRGRRRARAPRTTP